MDSRLGLRGFLVVPVDNFSRAGELRFMVVRECAASTPARPRWTGLIGSFRLIESWC